MARKHTTTAQQHPASPLAIDVARLGRRPGSMVTLRNTVPSPLRMGLDMIAIQQGAPLDMDLRVESVSEGVLVTGTVSGPTFGECSRCLAEVNGHVQVGLTELFAYPASTTEATTDEDEVGRVIDDRIDLQQFVIDAVGLELPLVPVCRPDCPGLCPECGVLLANDPSHHHDTIDPRWAKLVDMLSDDSGEPDSSRGDR